MVSDHLATKSSRNQRNHHQNRTYICSFIVITSYNWVNATKKWKKLSWIEGKFSLNRYFFIIIILQRNDWWLWNFFISQMLKFTFTEPITQYLEY